MLYIVPRVIFPPNTQFSPRICTTLNQFHNQCVTLLNTVKFNGIAQKYYNSCEILQIEALRDDIGAEVRIMRNMVIKETHTVMLGVSPTCLASDFPVY